MMKKRQYLAMAGLFLMLGLGGCPAGEEDSHVDTKSNGEQSSQPKRQQSENPFQTNETLDEKDWEIPKEWEDKEWKDEQGWDKEWKDEKGWDEKQWEDEQGWDNKQWDNDGKGWDPDKK